MALGIYRVERVIFVLSNFDFFVVTAGARPLRGLVERGTTVVVMSGVRLIMLVHGRTTPRTFWKLTSRSKLRVELVIRVFSPVAARAVRPTKLGIGFPLVNYFSGVLRWFRWGRSGRR